MDECLIFYWLVYLAHEADAEHAALLEKKSTLERDLARQTEEERTLTAQLAAEMDTKAQLAADIDAARIVAEETVERGSIAGSEASDVDFGGVFQSNEAESFEDLAPTEVSLGGAPGVHRAVAALRREVSAAKTRLGSIEAEMGGLSQSTEETESALAAIRMSTQSLHAELLNVKAERILLQADADDDTGDGCCGRDLSTGVPVEFDAMFNGGGDGLPRDRPNSIALPPAAQAEMARMRGILEATQARLSEVYIHPR